MAAAVIGIVVLVNRTRSSNKAASSHPPCPAVNGSSPRQTSFHGTPPMCINTKLAYSATIDTDLGPFTVALLTKQAPLTVNNFVFLSRYHFYNGLTFHRVIPGFVVQGGDPKGNGTGGPGYKFADELPKAGAYKIGSLAMANSGPNTNGSQFFIITGPQGVRLAPKYSLFGQVTSGMAVVSRIESDGGASGTPKVVHKMLNVTISQS
jgi:cyclophilin family peptidyl-prolyl cis-trans isomerase